MPTRLTATRVTPTLVTPTRVTPTRVTPTRVTPTRVTPTRVTPTRVTPTRLTPTRVTPTLVWGMPTLVWGMPTLVCGIPTLVMPVLLTSGFATSAFLVAVRLLIKDFFWMAMSFSSQGFGIFSLYRRLSHKHLSCQSIQHPAGTRLDRLTSTTCAPRECCGPFPETASGPSWLKINLQRVNY